MAAGGDGDGEKSAFRCIDAARYVVAAMMIMLIATVIVNAIRVVLRPDKIMLSVNGNSVITESDENGHLNFKFTLHGVNPSGRVRLYYYNISAYVFANDTMATTPTPDDDSDVYFSDDVRNMTLAPNVNVDNTYVNDGIMDSTFFKDSTFFNDLYKPGGRVGGVTMRVAGQLVSEIRWGINTTAQNISFYCRDLVFGPEDKVAMSTQGTTCSTS